MGLILITRPEDDALDYAAELQAEGFETLVAPMLVIVPTAFEQPDLSKYQALLFTSANAVRIFAEMVKSRVLPVFVVGPHTEKEARTQGFGNVISANGTGDELAVLVRTKITDKTKPLLHVRGAHAAKPLHILLAPDGIKVDLLTVYDSEKVSELSMEARSAIENNRVEAVTFFSKRTAQNFAALADSLNLKGIKGLCLSNAVLECVQSCTWAKTYVAGTPDRAGMLALLRSVCMKRDIKEKEGIMMTNSTMAEGSDAIENAEEVIERFGGIRPMAKKIDVAVTTVQGWKKRNVIPGTRRAQVLQAAVAHNVDLSDILDDVAAIPPANENQRKGNDAPIPLTSASSVPSASVPTASKPGDLEKKLAETEKKAVTKSTWINIILLILALGAVVVLLWPNKNMQGQQGERLSSLEQNVDQIRTDVDAVKEEQSFLSTLIPKDLDQRIADLQTQARDAQQKVTAALDKAGEVSNDVLGENAGSMQERMQKLGGHWADISATPEVAALLQRFQGMSESVPGQAQLEQTIAELAALTAQQQDPATIETTLDAARTQSTTIGQTFEGVHGQDMKAAAMLLAMSQFRQSLNRDNQPFKDDLQLLISLVGEDNPELKASLERLAPQAEQGVLTPQGLGNEFRTIAGDAVVASLKGEDVSLQDKTRARMNEIFQIEKNGELVSGTETQMTLAKAEDLLSAGDMQGAVAQVQTLEGAPAQTFAPWIEQANATIEAEKLKTFLAQGVGSLSLGQSKLIQNKETGINILETNSPQIKGMYE
jgi:uroporphyrinogen-III synthase